MTLTKASTTKNTSKFSNQSDPTQYQIREREWERDLSKNLLRQTGALEEGDGFGAADFAVAVQIGSTEIRIEEIHIRRLVLRRSHFFFCRRRRRSRNSKQPPRACVCVWRIDQNIGIRKKAVIGISVRECMRRNKIVVVRSTGTIKKYGFDFSICMKWNDFFFFSIYFWVCDSMKEKTDGDSERERRKKKLMDVFNFLF